MAVLPIPPDGITGPVWELEESDCIPQPCLNGWPPSGGGVTAVGAERGSPEAVGGAEWGEGGQRRATG